MRILLYTYYGFWSYGYPRDFKGAPGFFYYVRNRTGDYKMGKKIYVGNISFKATEDDIRELFAGSGEVDSVKLITDMHTGNPKGFGFVEMATSEGAQKAIEALNGTMFMDRILSVDEAKPQQPREGRGGARGGRGGFKSGRGSSGRGSGPGSGWR
jgi:RNA recognition motif-containing protein